MNASRKTSIFLEFVYAESIRKENLPRFPRREQYQGSLRTLEENVGHSQIDDSVYHTMAAEKRL